MHPRQPLSALACRQAIQREVHLERERQDEKWGGPAFDDCNLPEDWTTYINNHLEEVRAAFADGDTGRARKALIEVAALAVAAVESGDRKSAHVAGALPGKAAE